MPAAPVDTDNPSTSRADQRRAMGGAAERDRRYQAAYEAGLHGVAASEHFAGRDDVDDLERDSHRAGVDERRSGRRRTRARSAAGHARSVAGTSGGYLARAGRSVTGHISDTPTGGGGGSFAGVMVAVLGVIFLYLLLGNAAKVTTVISGISRGLNWLIAPTPLPF